MNNELDLMIGLWKEENEISSSRLDTIRIAARNPQKDEAMSVDWWKSILTIPKSAFLSKVA